MSLITCCHFSASLHSSSMSLLHFHWYFTSFRKTKASLEAYPSHLNILKWDLKTLSGCCRCNSICRGPWWWSCNSRADMSTVTRWSRNAEKHLQKDADDTCFWNSERRKERVMSRTHPWGCTLPDHVLVSVECNWGNKHMSHRGWFTAAFSREGELMQRKRLRIQKLKIHRRTARCLPWEHLVWAAHHVCPEATANAKWFFNLKKGWIITNQYNITMFVITREGGDYWVGEHLQCHMFYSQADDVCQVYVFTSVHSVLAFAQMCKPAEAKYYIWKKPTCWLYFSIYILSSWRKPLTINVYSVRINQK